MYKKWRIPQKNARGLEVVMLMRMILVLLVVMFLIVFVKGENDRLSSECDKKNGRWLERDRVCMKKEFFVDE